MNKRVRLYFDGGQMYGLYHDFLKPLLKEASEQEITRISDVEPDMNGDWVADMRKSGHDVQSPPFALREEALRWEEEFAHRQIYGALRHGDPLPGSRGSGGH